MKHKLMIVDDHAVVRDGLLRLLETSGQYDVISQADSAEQAIAQCRNQLPELVIMDLSMPGMGGMEAIRRMRSKWPELKILVFSIYQNSQLAKRILEAGAQGYVTKSNSSDLLIEAINSVISGKSFVSPDISTESSPLFESKPLAKLSTRELDIFKRVAEGMNTEEISQTLFLSEKTVANNVSIIKKKLKASTTAELVHIALSEGLLMNINDKNKDTIRSSTS